MTGAAADAVTARCDRARQHLAVLLLGLSSWTVDLLTTIAPDGLSQVTRLYPLDPDAAQRWALDLSDLLHSARAALDNTVYALSEAHVGTMPPDRARLIHFPVRMSEAAFRERPVVEALALLSPGARTVIEQAQPWRVAEPPGHPLQVLVMLSNIDKHRRLNVVTSSVTGGDLPLPTPDGIASSGVRLGPITAGFEYHSVQFKTPQTEPWVVPLNLAARHWVDEPSVLREDLRELATRLVDHVDALVTELLDEHLHA